MYNIHIIRKIPRVNHFDDEDMRKLKILSTKLHLCHSTREFHTHYQDSCHFFPIYAIVHKMPSARLGPMGHCMVNMTRVNKRLWCFKLLQLIITIILGKWELKQYEKVISGSLYWITYPYCRQCMIMMVWTLRRSHDCTIMFLFDYSTTMNLLYRDSQYGYIVMY